MPYQPRVFYEITTAGREHYKFHISPHVFRAKLKRCISQYAEKITDLDSKHISVFNDPFFA